MAEVGLIEMADRIKVFPLAVLGTMVLFGLLVWWAIARAKAAEPKIAGPDDPQFKDPAFAVAPPGAARGTKIQSAASPSVEAPPPAKDPGEKILEGADGAYERGMFETALKFYKDFELWYAGTETYDRHVLRVFERIHTSGAKMRQKDETLPAYLEGRRKAADEWKRLKPLLATAPTESSRAEIQKYLDGLPPKDGRRTLIAAWQTPGSGEK